MESQIKNKYMNTYSSKDGIIEPINKFPEYIIQKLKQLGWSHEYCSQKSKISKGEISKIINRQRQTVSAKTFYQMYTSFGDSCEVAFKFVYPDVKLVLHKYITVKRNVFGNFMLQFENEIDENSPDVIAQKTKISNQRINELYFKKGALQAYELLLIEHAIGKKPGELFEEFYEKELGRQ